MRSHSYVVLSSGGLTLFSCCPDGLKKNYDIRPFEQRQLSVLNFRQRRLCEPSTRADFGVFDNVLNRDAMRFSNLTKHLTEKDSSSRYLRFSTIRTQYCAIR